MNERRSGRGSPHPLAFIPALAVLALVSLAPVGGSAEAPAGDSPVWSLGEQWGYEGVVWGPGPRENFTASVTVIALSEVEARLRAEISYGFGTVVQDTLVALPSFRVMRFNSSFPSGIHHEFVYGSPLELFSFPLSAGKTWSSVSDFTYSYVTLDLTEVATPAGVFEAYPVLQSAMGIPFLTLELIVPGLGYAVMYYAASVGQIVRYEAFDHMDALVAEFSITSMTLGPEGFAGDRGPDATPAGGVLALLLAGGIGGATVQALRTFNMGQSMGRRGSA